MRLLKRHVHRLVAAAILRLRKGRGAVAWQIAQQALGRAHQHVMIHGSRRAQDHALCSVIGVAEAHQVVAAEVAHTGSGAQHWPAQRLIRESNRERGVEQHILGVIPRRSNFLQDNRALQPKILLLVDRVAQYVGQHVQRAWHLILENPGEIRGRLHPRRGIDLTARGLDLLGDIAG